MRPDDDKRSIHRGLVDRILHGPGRAPTEERAQAFANANHPEPLRGLLDKVATRSAQVTDTDFDTALGAGFTDDQLFELVSCAAVGEATRQYADFYGTCAKKFTQEAMRGDSRWSVGDRELMAAYVSKVNDCPFCVGTPRRRPGHTAIQKG
jgi:hypothetical protein